MNQNGDDNPFCYFHPKEKLVGVCAFCLKEKLLILASKQGHHPSKDTRSSYNFLLHNKASLAIPKIFAFGSFLHRSRQSKSVDFDHDTSTSSQEGSFISIKFEDNGAVLWDKGTNSSKMAIPQKPNKLYVKALDDQDSSRKGTTKKLIEHVKPHVTSMWWQKRIGQLLQVVRWKRTNKVGGVKVKKGWIRTLSKNKKKKRTME